MMHALKVLCDDLWRDMLPYAEEDIATQPRLQQLTDGIPWMLRDERYVTTPCTMHCLAVSCLRHKVANQQGQLQRGTWS